MWGGGGGGGRGLFILLNHNRMNQVNISIYDFKVNNILYDKKAIYQVPPP